MTPHASAVFLIDIDHLLLDVDQIIADLNQQFTRAFGADHQKRQWAIFETLCAELV